MRLAVKTLHMNVDYNPYEGREVTGVDRDGHLARQGRHRRREVRRQSRRRIVPEAQHETRWPEGPGCREARPSGPPEIDDRRRNRRAVEEAHHLRVVGAGRVDPIPVARAKGVYFWTPEGKRYLDFNSQLMCVNIGHGDQRVVKAIQEQAAMLAYANPFMATEPRARLGAKLAELRPATSTSSSSPTAGAEANENAFKIARAFTGRQKILARYRSYHGATAAAISRDRRSAALEPAADAGLRPRARSVPRHRARLGNGRGGAARISRR